VRIDRDALVALRARLETAGVEVEAEGEAFAAADLWGMRLRFEPA
jgi:hypothetical protein